MASDRRTQSSSYPWANRRIGRSSSSQGRPVPHHWRVCKYWQRIYLQLVRVCLTQSWWFLPFRGIRSVGAPFLEASTCGRTSRLQFWGSATSLDFLAPRRSNRQPPNWTFEWPQSSGFRRLQVSWDCVLISFCRQSSQDGASVLDFPKSASSHFWWGSGHHHLATWRSFGPSFLESWASQPPVDIHS